MALLFIAWAPFFGWGSFCIFACHPIIRENGNLCVFCSLLDCVFVVHLATRSSFAECLSLVAILFIVGTLIVLTLDGLFLFTHGSIVCYEHLYIFGASIIMQSGPHII